MLQFNWGVFWAVLAATGIVCFVVVGYISKQIETLNRVLLYMEQTLTDIRNKIV
jgi:hypothetical protein